MKIDLVHPFLTLLTLKAETWVGIVTLFAELVTLTFSVVYQRSTLLLLFPEWKLCFSEYDFVFI